MPDSMRVSRSLTRGVSVGYARGVLAALKSREALFSLSLAS